MATYIYIDNYRGFSKTWIPLRQVSFLVGENSTGKTSVLELLEMFCHTRFWVFDPQFGVPGSHPRHFHDLVSASSKSKRHFTIGALSVPIGDDEPCSGMLITYQNSDGRAVPKRVSIVDGETVRTVEGNLWINKKGEQYRARVKTCKGVQREIMDINSLSTFAEAHQSNAGFCEREVPDKRYGSPIFFRFEEDLYGKTGEARQIKAPAIFRSSFVELAPIRSKPKRTYDAPQTEFSPEGDHTPYVIRKRLANKAQTEEFTRFLEQIGRESGLFESISVKNYGKDSLSPFEIKIVLGKAALGLDNVGYGVSQALPVIVEIFVRPRRTLFTIQQPEVHLHPRAQASIGDLVAEISRSEEKRFVIETHSDFTIDRFRLNVRKHGEISSQLLFFKRTEFGNKVTSIPITPDGSLPADQPDSYREFFFNESLSLLG